MGMLGLSGTERETEGHTFKMSVVQPMPPQVPSCSQHACGATQVRTDRSLHPALRLAESHQKML